MYCVDDSLNIISSKFNFTRFGGDAFFMQSATAMQSLIRAKHRGTGTPEDT
jgi:hypothetical protein